MIVHGDAALDRRTNAQLRGPNLKPCIDERLFQRHRVRAALTRTDEEVRTEAFPLHRITDVRAELSQPLVDEYRNRRDIEKVLSAANFHRDPTLFGRGLRGGRIAEQMKPVVLLTAIRLSLARAMARKKRARAIAGNSG